MVEPNVVGGWDVRPAAGQGRHSRHGSRDEAVAAARELGDVTVVGMRGEVLARYPEGAEATAPRRGPAEPPPRADAGPPAARRPGMRISQLLSLSDQTDASGRLLLEDSAPRQAIRKAERAGISMKTMEAPYQDTPSRLGGKMNAAAYDALRHDTAAILNGFAWLADHHRAVAPGESGAPQRLYATSYLGVSLPHVLFHRAEQPVAPHGELPPYIASIFKASRGLFSFAIQLENDVGASATMTPAEVLQYAEEHRQLVRPDTGRVCAAPTRLIERTLSVILEGHGAEASKSTLGELVDFGMLWEFYRLQDEFGRVLSLFRVVAEHLTATGVATDPSRLLRTVIPSGPAKGKTFGRFTEEVLGTVNDLQAGMNRALGRAGNVRGITLPELMQLL